MSFALIALLWAAFLALAIAFMRGAGAASQRPTSVATFWDDLGGAICIWLAACVLMGAGMLLVMISVGELP